MSLFLFGYTTLLGGVMILNTPSYKFLRDDEIEDASDWRLMDKYGWEPRSKLSSAHKEWRRRQQMQQTN